MCYQKVIQFPQKKFNGPIPVAATFSNSATAEKEILAMARVWLGEKQEAAASLQTGAATNAAKYSTRVPT